MDREWAIDAIDLTGIAAASELCGHMEGGACLDCTVSTVANLWRAIDVVRGSDWPADGPTPGMLHGASL